MSQENFTADPQDVQANKVMAILAYFGLLVFVPLFAAKESRFARFHTNQGLILLTKVSHPLKTLAFLIYLCLSSPISIEF